MEMLSQASLGDIDLTDFNLVENPIKKLDLLKDAHDTIEFYQIDEVVKLATVLSKWVNFLPLRNQDLCEPAKCTRGLHWDLNDGCLYVLDLVHKEKLKFCWKERCAMPCDDNKLALCSTHSTNHSEDRDITPPPPPQDCNNTADSLPWGLSREYRIRNEVEEAFSILLNNVHRLDHPTAKKMLYVREDFNEKFSNKMASYLIKEGSATYNGIKIAYSLLWDIFVYQLPNSEVWHKKCLETKCFFAAHENSTKCDVHRDKSEWKQTALRSVMKIVGVSTWEGLTDEKIELAKEKYLEEGKEDIEIPHEGTHISFEDGEIFLHHEKRNFKVCNGYANGCQNIMAVGESCNSCTALSFYVPYVLRHSNGIYFYVSKVVRHYGENEDLWKARAKKNLWKVVARYNKENTIDSKNDFVPLNSADFDFVNLMYCGELCSLKWSLVAIGGLALYIAYEAAILKKEAIFINKRLSIAPCTSVFMGFGRIANRAGLRWTLIHRNFKLQAEPQDRNVILDCLYDVENAGYTPRIYRARNAKTKLVYIGLWEPKAHEERVKDRTIAPVHYGFGDQTNYQQLLGDPEDIKEERFALVMSGANPLQVKSICILAEKFGAEMLLNGDEVVNNYIERMPIATLNWFDQLRQTILTRWGRTFAIEMTDKFMPMAFK